MKNTLILIPSYEPDELLTQTVNQLLENDFLVMVINDGSGKEFDAIFDTIKDKVCYLSYSKNKGKGYALKYGYRHIKENFPNVEYVITADGDGQHALKDIICVNDELEKNNELVFGVRHFDKHVPFRSRFGNDWSKVSRSLLTKQYIPDDQCGLRGFPVRYIPELIKIKGSRYEYEMNQLVLFQLKQYPMITLPIETIYLDSNSRSHFSPFLDTCRIQGIILKHAIPSIVCFILQILSLVLFIKYDFADYKTICIFSYTWTFALYFLLISVIYPSKSYFRRLLKELLFTALRMAACFIILDIFSTHFGINPFIVLPFAVIFATSFNVFLAWAFRRMFKTF